MIVERLNAKDAWRYILDWESWRAGEQEEPPRGLYWYEEDIEGTTRYTVIDNSEGECWQEDFATLELAMDWIRKERRNE